MRQREPGPEGPIAAYYSHHKCATMYVAGILGRICREAGLDFVSYDDPRGYGGDLEEHLRGRSVDVLSVINARWEDVDPLGEVPAFHVIRDPRDILVSAYFSHLHTHPTDEWPELRAHRNRLESVSKDEGLLLELEFSAGVFEDMAGWDYDTEHILELTFEELTGRPYQTFLAVFEHLGLIDRESFGLRRSMAYAIRGLWNQASEFTGGWLPTVRRTAVPGGRILGVVYDNRFSRRAGGREPGHEDRGSHYRRGEAGDWRRHLGQRHLEALRSRFPDLLDRTGYGDRGAPEA